MRVYLRAERAGRIDVDLIFDNRSALCTLNLPAALVEFVHGKRLTGAVFRTDPVHVLGEVADLIQRVPHGKLEFTLCATWGQDDLDFDEMLFGRGERDCVTDRWR